MEQRGAHGLDFERSAAEAATAGAARPAGTAFGLRALPCASLGRPRCSSEQDHTRLPGSVDDGVLAALGCFRGFSFEEVYHGCVRTRCFGGRGPARIAVLQAINRRMDGRHCSRVVMTDLSIFAIAFIREAGFAEPGAVLWASLPTGATPPCCSAAMS